MTSPVHFELFGFTLLLNEVKHDSVYFCTNTFKKKHLMRLLLDFLSRANFILLLYF